MTPKQSEIHPDWYESAFSSLYRLVYAHRNVEAAGPEAEFAAEAVGLSTDYDVLDVGCGAGRHLFHLAPRTRSATGLDYSKDLLDAAAELLDNQPGARLVRGDMRTLPFVHAFDAVFSFFTSFGYFVDREENLRTLRSMARALRPGGTLFLDHVNAEHVAATLESRSERHERDLTIIEERWIDERLRRVNKRTRVLKDDDEKQRFHESVQLYEPEEFERLLVEGGFRVERLCGDYTGAPVDAERPRMIAVGRKA